jgi:3-methyl-2-oxobutanoate hydroxymethyltransferase
MVSRVKRIIESGIPVMGHIGLTPQSATMLGGFKTQGKTAEAARRLIADARQLEAVGCCSIVLEAIPAPVAARITAELSIPTIGIGAGPECDGQVLVYHDLLGLSEGHLPRFVRRYANLCARSATRSSTTRQTSAPGRSPARSTPCSMSEAELEAFAT